MHVPGWHYLAGLLKGRNVIVMAGPLVIKRVGNPNPRKKYYSEIAARRLLSQVGVSTIPIHIGIKPVGTFVMQRAARPTLNRMLTKELLATFGEHVAQLAADRLPRDTPDGYYWLDEPANVRRHPTYVDFLRNESIDDQAMFSAAYPAFDLRSINEVLGQADPRPDRLLVLTDVAPKNVVFHDGTFTHLDLEVTLVGPPEFLLVKAAINLASDVGDKFDGRRVRKFLLDRCAHAANARAALVFAMVRRMEYEARARSSDPRAAAALGAVLAGESLENAITRLEGSWDVTELSANGLLHE
jgi:hypothetical protein